LALRFGPFDEDPPELPLWALHFFPAAFDAWEERGFDFEGVVLDGAYLTINDLIFQNLIAVYLSPSALLESLDLPFWYRS
jgi:hypothetical protein